MAGFIAVVIASRVPDLLVRFPDAFWILPLVMALFVGLIVTLLFRLLWLEGPSAALGIPPLKLFSRRAWRFASTWNPLKPAEALRALAVLERGPVGREELDHLMDSPTGLGIVEELRKHQRRVLRRAWWLFVAFPALWLVPWLALEVDWVRPLLVPGLAIAMAVSVGSTMGVGQVAQVYVPWVNALDRLRESGSSPNPGEARP